MKSGNKVPLKPLRSGKPCSKSGETIRIRFIGPHSSSWAVHNHFWARGIFLLIRRHFYLGGQIAMHVSAETAFDLIEGPRTSIFTLKSGGNQTAGKCSVNYFPAESQSL